MGVTGLIAGWMAIAVVQEITAETFRGFHDIRLATLLGGLATGGKSGGVIMRVLLLGMPGLAMGDERRDEGLRTVLFGFHRVGFGERGAVAVAVVQARSPRSVLQKEHKRRSPVSAKEVLERRHPVLGSSP